MSAGGYCYYDRGVVYEVFYRNLTFYTKELFVRAGGKIVQLDLPDHVKFSSFRDHCLITLRKDWAVNATTYTSGSLLTIPLAALLAKDMAKLAVLFEPGARTSLKSFLGTKDYLVISVLDNVRTKLLYLRFDAAAQGGAGGWVDEKRPWSFPNMARCVPDAVSADDSNDLWLIRTGFTAPTTLFLGSAQKGVEPKEVKKLPEQYAAAGKSSSPCCRDRRT